MACTNNKANCCMARFKEFLEEYLKEHGIGTGGGNTNLHLKTINGQSLIGDGNIEIDTDLDNIDVTANAESAEHTGVCLNKTNNKLAFQFLIEKGKDGLPGQPGENGTPGKPGEDGAPGKNGKNGLSEEEIRAIINSIIDGIKPTLGNYGGSITVPIYKVTDTASYGELPDTETTKWVAGSNSIATSDWKGWKTYLDNGDFVGKYVWMSMGTFNTQTGDMLGPWSYPFLAHDTDTIYDGGNTGGGGGGGDKPNPNPGVPDEDRGLFTDSINIDYAFYLTTEDCTQGSAGYSTMLSAMNVANAAGKRVMKNSYEGINKSQSHPNEWVDNAQGVDERYTREYMIFSLIVESKDEKGNKTETVTPYQGPILINHYGESGVDGDGVQYIFSRTNDDKVPARVTYPTDGSVVRDKAIAEWPIWDSNGEANINGTIWTDDPKGVSADGFGYEWVSERKYRFDDTAKKKIWSEFSKPALWAKYAADGVGQYLVEVFCAVENKDNEGGTYVPKAPVGGMWNIKNSTFNPENTPKLAAADEEYKKNNYFVGWQLDDYFETDKSIVIYKSQAYFNAIGGLVEVGGRTWTTPVRITGADGRAGADGKNIEFIYLRTTAEVDIEEIYDNHFGDVKEAGSADANGADFTPVVGGYTWKDSPEGVEEGMPYEWMSYRKLITVGNSTVWSKFSIPSKWSVYGSVGQDGDGVEYIFCVTKSEFPQNDPSTLEASQKPDYVPFENEVIDKWSDNPQTVSEEYPVQWVSVRHFKKPEGSPKGQWGKFSTPTIWSVYGREGIPGLTVRVAYGNDATAKKWDDSYTTYENGKNTPPDWYYDIPNIDSWAGSNIWKIVGYFSGTDFATKEQGAPYVGWSKPMLDVNKAKIAAVDYTKVYIFGTDEDLILKSNIENYLGLNLFTDGMSEENVFTMLSNSDANGTWVNATSISEVSNKAWLWQLVVTFDAEDNYYKSHYLMRITPKDGENSIDIDELAIAVKGKIDPPEGSTGKPVMIFRAEVGTVDDLDYRTESTIPENYGWSKDVPDATDTQTIWYAIGIEVDGEMIAIEGTYPHEYYWSAPAYYSGYTQVVTGPQGNQGLQGIDGIPGVDMWAVYTYTTSKTAPTKEFSISELNSLITNSTYGAAEFSLSYSGAQQYAESRVTKPVQGANYWIWVKNITRGVTRSTSGSIEDNDLEYTDTPIIENQSDWGLVSVDSGTQGKTGKILYPAGEWTEDAAYEADKDSTPYVLYGGEFYFLNAEGPVSGTSPDRDSRWHKMDSVVSMYAKYIIAGGGSFGSLCFYDRWIFSQQGSTSNFKDFEVTTDDFPKSGFIPNFAVNCKTGDVYMNGGKTQFKADGTTDLAGGNIHIEPDGSGNIAKGSIAWDTYGNITANRAAIVGVSYPTNEVDAIPGDTRVIDIDMGTLDYFESVYSFSRGSDGNPRSSVFEFRILQNGEAQTFDVYNNTMGDAYNFVQTVVPEESNYAVTELNYTRYGNTVEIKKIIVTRKSTNPTDTIRYRMYITEL